ncbi:dihydrofolate reductase [Herbihabitans rhizosphaerae]|uniref:Dihydrofolate reductase n=1 Tax=Herbihabitans rhizosphaerae TaxID=1872711 RepID=A0A4Q7KGL4_9PSEU|nr:dihydrofolate reductase family protein [Herbihabitans rhizosphaerae]RZS31322.1 dihydrofolate reductase [Herbihabitans rhizosphaerae]
MTTVICNFTMSLDGYMAGPNQSVDDPLGQGGMKLMEWMLSTPTFSGEDGERTVDDDMVDEVRNGYGAFVMGRNMFGPIRGEWDLSWKGWWGDEPSYHAPVFVLTHYPRESVPMEGGTTFHFVTDGIASAVERAKEAAGDKPVLIAGGAAAIRQALAAGLVDEINTHIAPLIFGAGERPLDGLDETRLEPIRVIESPKVTHVRYRVIR